MAYIFITQKMLPYDRYQLYYPSSYTRIARYTIMSKQNEQIKVSLYSTDEVVPSILLLHHVWEASWLIKIGYPASLISAAVRQLTKKGPNCCLHYFKKTAVRSRVMFTFCSFIKCGFIFSLLLIHDQHNPNATKYFPFVCVM